MHIRYRTIQLRDISLSWEGAVQFEFSPVTDNEPMWVRPWRVDPNHLRMFEPILVKRAYDAAGVRFSLTSNTSTLKLGVDPCLEIEPIEPQSHWTFDIYIDDELHDRITKPREQCELIFSGWTRGEHRLTVYGPIISPVKFTSVAVDHDCVIRSPIKQQPRWIVYGSSITQCGGVSGPSETWPAIVARRWGFDHVNLGFGGNATLDPSIAAMIANMPADLISVCFSVNNYNAYTPRTWRPAVLGFIQRIRLGHPCIPIACTSPIWSGPHETTPSITGLTLVSMRKQVEDAIDILNKEGDTNIYYVDGLELFNRDQAIHMPDSLHPDTEGYRILANHYSERIMSRLGIGVNQSSYDI